MSVKDDNNVAWFRMLYIQEKRPKTDSVEIKLHWNGRLCYVRQDTGFNY